MGVCWRTKTYSNIIAQHCREHRSGSSRSKIEVGLATGRMNRIAARGEFFPKANRGNWQLGSRGILLAAGAILVSN